MLHCRVVAFCACAFLYRALQPCELPAQEPRSELPAAEEIRASALKWQCELVFVGELRSASYDWSPPSGIGLSEQRMKFKVVEVLRGNLQQSRIAVYEAMVGPVPYVEENSETGLLRLSPAVLRPGTRWIVVTRRWATFSPGKSHHHLCGGMRLLPATPESAAVFRAALAELPETPGGSPIEVPH